MLTSNLPQSVYFFGLEIWLEIKYITLNTDKGGGLCNLPIKKEFMLA